MTTKNAGDEGVIWRIAIVENLDDPLMLGRVRARSISDHDNLETDELPWAHVLLPSTSSTQQQVGLSPTGLDIGTHVLMIFLDGRERQKPLIVGTLAKIPNMDTELHDVSKLARGENSLTKESVGPEPSSPYAATYPNNKVFQTKSGHVIEVDDTEGAERIHVWHKSGSYIEIDSKGNRTDKIKGSHVDITVADKTVYVKGNATIEVVGNIDIKVEGNATAKIEGNLDAEVGGNVNVKASQINIEADTISIKGNLKVNGSSSFEGGGLTHNGINVGSTHKHGQVMSGGAISGVVVA